MITNCVKEAPKQTAQVKHNLQMPTDHDECLDSHFSTEHHAFPTIFRAQIWYSPHPHSFDSR